MTNNSNKRELRSFGFTIAIILLAIAAWKVFRAGIITAPIEIIAGVGILFFIAAAIVPDLLYWPRLIWLRIGDALGFVNSRIILAAIFYFIITPVAIIRRCIGSRTLDLQFDGKLQSYAGPSRKREANHMKAPF